MHECSAGGGRHSSRAVEIVYLDDDIVAVNKPAGMLVHRSELAVDREGFLLQSTRDVLGRRVYAVHRLDRPVSGVLVFGLHRDVARELSAAFAARRVDKRYLAVVRGFTAHAGVIDRPLREWSERALSPGGQAVPGRPAVTHYRRLAAAELPVAVGPHASARYSLLELRPHTGRRHQLRRHLNYVAHPVIGDVAHGDARHNRLFRDQFDCHRLLLAAIQLSFAHPRSGQTISLQAELDEAFHRVIGQLGWKGVLAGAGTARVIPIAAG